MAGQAGIQLAVKLILTLMIIQRVKGERGLKDIVKVIESREIRN